MIDHGGGGGGCQNAQNKTSLILYKPVGKINLQLACIRAFVMIASYLSTKTYVVGTQKNRHNEMVL